MTGTVARPYALAMLPEIVVVSPTLEPVSRDAIAALQDRIGAELPQGYAQLVGTLGEGTFCNEFNVFSPTRILEQVDKAREAWAQYWFWDEDVVTQAEMAGAFRMGDSSNGDELAFVPDRGLVLLPRDDEQVRTAGSSYIDALTSFCTSGDLVDPSGILWFQSWAQQSCYENWSGGDLETVRRALAGLGLHVAEDHDPERRTSTFLVPAIGGHVRVAALAGSDLYVHLRYVPEESATADEVAGALEAAGSTRTSRWGAERVG